MIEGKQPTLREQKILGGSVSSTKSSTTQKKPATRPRQLVNQKKTVTKTTGSQVKRTKSPVRANMAPGTLRLRSRSPSPSRANELKVKDHRQALLLSTLKDFFSKKANIKKALPAMMGESDISLRIFDWFVVNYSNKKNVYYELKDRRGHPYKFFVHNSYKAQLKAYSKRQFDPFCRRGRIEFDYGGKEKLVTTVGQLNFFKWAIEYKVIDYVKKHLKEIEKDMNTSTDHHSRKKGGDSTSVLSIVPQKGASNKRKKKELSISSSKKVNLHNVEIIVRFD